jgi:hypothetical protein
LGKGTFYLEGKGLRRQWGECGYLGSVERRLVLITYFWRADRQTYTHYRVKRKGLFNKNK